MSMLASTRTTVAQQLSWVKDIESSQGGAAVLAGVAVIEDGGLERTIIVGNVTGRLADAVPAVPGTILGVYDPTEREIFLRKIDAAGNVAWTVQYPMTPQGSSSIGATAMAADATGIYVAGTWGGNLSGQVFVARFSAATGQFQWLQQFGASGYYSRISDLAVDAGGVTVCGDTYGDLALDPDPKASAAGYLDAFVSRWSLAGVHLATDQFGVAPAQPGMSGRAKALAIAPDGAICVVSDVPVYEGGRWWIIGEVRRYDPGPTSLALRDRRLLDLGGFQTLPLDIAVDSGGIVGVAQAVASWEPNHVFGLSSSNLAVTWDRAITGLQAQSVLVVGAQAFVGGGNFTGSQSPGEQGMLAVLDATTGTGIGAPLVFPNSSGFYPRKLASAGSAVITAGESNVGVDGVLGGPAPTGGRDIVVGRLQGTSFELVQQIHSSAPQQVLLGGVGCDGSSYVGFSTRGTVDGVVPIGGTDVYVQRYLADGSLSWSRVFGSTQAEEISSLCMDETSIYISGRAYGGVLPGEIAMGAGTIAVFVMRLDLDGNVLWTRTFRHPSNHVEPMDLSVDGNALLLGGAVTNTNVPWLSVAPTGFGQAFAVRLDAVTGQPAWTRAIAAPTGTLAAEGIASQGESLYLAGTSHAAAWPGQPSFGSTDAFLLKVDLATGQSLSWARVFGSTNQDLGYDVVCASDGIYVGGVNGATPYNGMVRRFTPNGDLTGDWSITGSMSGSDLVTSLAADASGVYAAGRTAGLDGQPYAGGIGDGFVCKLGSASGTLAWVQQIGTAAFDEVFGISVCEGCVGIVGKTGGSFADPLRRLQPSAREWGFVARISLDQPPTANPGPNQPAHCGLPVVLDGNGSFDDNTPTSQLLFQWELLSKPFGSAAVLVQPDQPVAGLVPDMVGDYLVRLTVTDNLGQSGTATVTISSSNQPPLAMARAASTTYPGQVLMLDGTGSTDPDGDPLTYQWVLASAPAGSASTVQDAHLATARFEPDLAGSYAFTLIVRDLCSDSEPVTLQLLVITSRQYATQQVLAAQVAAAALTEGQWDNANMAQPFDSLLRNALQLLENGRGNVLQQLQLAMIRTDGVPLRNAVDGAGASMDWITDASAQSAIYAALLAAVGALQG